MELITKSLIDLHFHAENKDDVLRHLADLAEADGRLYDKDLFIQELYRREEEAPTNIGMNVAIPHGKDDSVKEPALMFLKLDSPITWNDEEADLIFGIAVPDEAEGTLHLELLAKIARKLMQDGAIESFYNAGSEQEIIDLLMTD